MKNKPQNQSAATPQGGAAAHSDIFPPIVPRQVSRKAGAKAAAQEETLDSNAASQRECQLVGVSWTSLMGLSIPLTITSSDGKSISLNLSTQDAENIIESLEVSLGRRQESLLALAKKEAYESFVSRRRRRENQE